MAIDFANLADILFRDREYLLFIIRRHAQVCTLDGFPGSKIARLTAVGIDAHVFIAIVVPTELHSWSKDEGDIAEHIITTRRFRKRKIDGHNKSTTLRATQMFGLAKTRWGEDALMQLHRRNGNNLQRWIDPLAAIERNRSSSICRAKISRWGFEWCLTSYLFVSSIFATTPCRLVVLYYCTDRRYYRHVTIHSSASRYPFTG